MRGPKNVGWLAMTDQKRDAVHNNEHLEFMKMALEAVRILWMFSLQPFTTFGQAEQALREGEVPVGCVIVHNHEVIGTGSNRTNTTHNVRTHSSIVILVLA